MCSCIFHRVTCSSSLCQFISGFNMRMTPWRFPAIVVCKGCTDECNVNKDCPPGKFCDVHTCRDCLHVNAACHFIGTCCEGYVCQYGHCTKGVKQGEPGTYCDKTSDCLSKESCCVREISVNSHTSICKPMLDEFESCGPINLFHHIYNGGMVEPDCGPCKDGLQCKNVGIKGLHFICLKEDED
ncbi:dickkopf-related protein 3-like isoform X2 [Montipora foliosa]|uniref:dickkopf-related protein 3-like isoform X2 n=1 Tax=Montipora foliosa TaxID=591990 RepID=UPI0035F1F414